MLPRAKTQPTSATATCHYFLAIPCLLVAVAYLTSGDGGSTIEGPGYSKRTAAHTFAEDAAFTNNGLPPAGADSAMSKSDQASKEGRITYVKVDDGGSGNNVVRYAAVDEGKNKIMYRRYMELLSQDTSHARRMATDLSSVIRDCPYRGLFFETMGVSTQNVDRVPFEFVLVDSPHLARFAESGPDEGAFAEHLDCVPTGAGCCAFDNLGGDARLIAPRMKSPKDAAKVYSHLAAFVRGAEPDHVAEVWRTAAKEFLTVLMERDGDNVFFSTSGKGVAWLHFRLDSIPKYYSYGEFARGA